MEPRFDVDGVRGEGPLVADVKRGALDDGPGIRSVVFYKGCTLRCRWCQNPEAVSRESEVLRSAERCAGCGACAAACPAEVARPAHEVEARASCTRCGRCLDACPAAARRLVGEPRAVDDLAALLLRDLPFYRRSGGGVTFSGGEAALFPRHLGAVAARLRGAGVHTLLETAGLFQWEPFAKHALPTLDAVWFDLKVIDPDRHRAATGADNLTILDNARRFAAHAAAGAIELLFRVPLVPGFTADADNLRAVAAFVASLGHRRLALLAYNPTWVGKRLGSGAETPALPSALARFMDLTDVERCHAAVSACGIEVVAV